MFDSRSDFFLNIVFYLLLVFFVSFATDYFSIVNLTTIVICNNLIEPSAKLQ